MVIFLDQLAYFSLHNDTLKQSQIQLHTYIVLRKITFQAWENAYIIICTPINIFVMVQTFTFYISTFVDTLSYITHKHINAFDHQICVFHMKCNHYFYFVGIEEFMMNGESKNKCRCWFEDGARTCGMVSYINHTWCNLGSRYLFYVRSFKNIVILMRGMRTIKKSLYL